MDIFSWNRTLPTTDLRQCETKKQWLSKNEVPVTTPKPGLDLHKLLLCVWWNIRGIVHYELLKPGNTIIAAVYCKHLERMNRKLKVERQNLVDRK